MLRKTALAALLGLTSLSSFAAIVSSAIPGGATIQLSDNSAEQLTNGTATTETINFASQTLYNLYVSANPTAVCNGTSCTTQTSSGALNVGDSLSGIFTINSIENLTGGGTTNIGVSTPTNELTGIFSTVVASKTVTGFDAVSGWIYSFTFGVDSTFDTNNTGVVAKLYDDSSDDYTRQGVTLNQSILSASNGTLWAELGLTGGFWSATGATDDLSDASLALLPLNSPLANFGNGLNLVTNNTGLMWGTVDCLNKATGGTLSVNFCGQGGVFSSGSLYGSEPTDSPWKVWNNIDYTAKTVPEPATLALAGLGLLGIGLSRRRKA